MNIDSPESTIGIGPSHGDGAGRSVRASRNQGLRLILPLLLLALCVSCGRPAAAACEDLPSLADRAPDASQALTDCLRRVPAGGKLLLKAGVYTIKQPIVVDKPVTIATAGLFGGASGCAELPGRCATILLDTAGTPKAGTMPLTIAADGVVLSHLVVRGAGISPRMRVLCGTPASRPTGGGLRVSGSHFTLRNSVLRGFACYSALEIVSGASSPTVENNVIGPDGDHNPSEVWSDGVTIHETDHASVKGNLFIDNTDVQLILGGCRDCGVENNRFRHSGPFSSASFAELMLQAWPNTSGDYRGTVVRGNSIDCGEHRRCGYGIMVGSAPWYEGRAAGAVITGNAVSNAMIAIDIDGLSGPAEIHGNVVRNSGGRFASDCGSRDWPAVNVAPASRQYVRGDPSNVAEGHVPTAGCLLNRREAS
jgi:Right handed beta helix region